MKNLTVVLDDKHARQQALPFSIYLDIRSGQLNVGYLTGQATAKRQQLVLQWPLPQEATSADLATLVNNHFDLFEQVLDNSYFLGKGHKQVGSFDAKAKVALAKLNDIFGVYPKSKYRLCDDLLQWLDGELYNDDYPDADSFAQFVLSHDGDDNCYFSGFFNHPVTMAQEILLLWEEDYLRGTKLPDYAIQALIENGCEHVMSQNMIMKKAKCVRCHQLKPVHELNGFDPITRDYSKAYCYKISECDSEKVKHIFNELVTEKVKTMGCRIADMAEAE